MSERTEAIRESVAVTKSVRATIFDDKVRECGRIEVQGGTIRVNLDYLPSIIDEQAAADFLGEIVGEAVSACYLRNSDAFESI